MARRSKSSEVLMVGDAADNRQRASARAPDVPSHASEKIRRQPKVIDARGTPTEAEAPRPVSPGSGDAGEHRKSAPATPSERRAESARPKPPAGKRPPSPKQSSKAVAKTMVNSMVERLRAEATRKGSLTVHDIDAMQADFVSQAEKLGQALEKSFGSYMDARERAEWDAKRDQPFDRVIVKSFSNLFSDDDFSRFDRVSRRMLPGFFMALGMMLGEELLDEYQEHCGLIVDRVRAEMGDGFNWDAVYAHADAKALMIDAAVTIAGHFTEYERRSEWFIGLINGNLAAFSGTPKEEAGWEMTPGGFKRFLESLFADLRREISSDAGKLRLTKRHGADTVADIVRVLKTVEA